MKTIWKYEVPVDDSFHQVRMPVGAKIVHIDVQHRIDVVCFWAVVNDNNDTIVRQFIVTGTGQEAFPYWDHVGTINISNQAQSLVWHLWETPTYTLGETA